MWALVKMGIETKKMVARQYRNGTWRQDDLQAKAWADEFLPLEKKKEDKKAKE